MKGGDCPYHAPSPMGSPSLGSLEESWRAGGCEESQLALALAPPLLHKVIHGNLQTGWLGVATIGRRSLLQWHAAAPPDPQLLVG